MQLVSMMRSQHRVLLGTQLKFLNKINVSQTLHFSALSPHFLQSHGPYILPILEQRKIGRELANLVQLPCPNIPIPYYYKKIHAHIVVLGFHQHDIFLMNTLLHKYSKLNLINDAQKLFDTMPHRNLVTWSSMVSMYTQHGYSVEALVLFCLFRRTCSEIPNEYILASVITACTRLGSLSQALQVHGLVVKGGFVQDVYVGTSLIDFYAKHGCIDEARLLFDGLEVKTTVTWTTMIAGYSKEGRSEASLELFNQMREGDVCPDRYVISSVLSACSMLEFLEGGKQIHGYVLRRGIDMDVSLVNGIIDFYLKCHKMKTGRKLFDRLVDKNVVSWTTMIAGCMQNSFHWDAMDLFIEMARMSWKPDAFGCTSILNSCGSLQTLEKGRQVHAYTIKANIDNDDFVKNGLIDMYAKCDSLTDARKVFDLMAAINAVSYNAMIEGYSRQDKLYEALDLFREMRLSLLPPNLLTFISLLGLSASLFHLELSNQIHGLIIKYGVSLDNFAGSALIDVYSKCSCVGDARLVFEEIYDKDIVVWNAMFSGYTQKLENEESLKLYKDLQMSRLKPNEFTFAAVITAASNTVSLRLGQQFHNQVKKMGLDDDPFVTNALVDMYAKCGSIDEANKAFSSANRRDIACWNSMISTYAQHGEAAKALEVFENVIMEGVKPNDVTFVGVLSACSHAGLLDLGFHHFESMSRFGIEPGMEHYACMVSLLGRAGRIYEAKEFIDKMPIKPAAVVWRSLLSACRLSGHVELGVYAAEMAISCDPTDSGSYILLSNIFASKGMWENVKKVREKMDMSGVVKEPGCSWIEVNNEVHRFIARDTAHRDSTLISLVLDNLILQIKGFGYAANSVAFLLLD
ncbi:pentatricopeptide repeat-containing protein At4g39530 [Gastrolobium bilobum]|uniref:pentatricopeptide repeat-containing protein At4g39530 n=1 Tax=Gastrolobium bilobum TaxID=150636 RepID=UPI002AB1148A|nr:pentatricopeptide repeat-containing protein At4g39530 [Gastrolobium bilobum]